MNSATSVTTRRTGANGINVALGIWMIISPFVLGFGGSLAAEWNNIAAGVAVLLVALTGGGALNVALGIWLIISPWVLGFAWIPTLLWNNVIIGALIGIFALTSGGIRSRNVTTPPPAA